MSIVLFVFECCQNKKCPTDFKIDMFENNSPEW